VLEIYQNLVLSQLVKQMRVAVPFAKRPLSGIKLADKIKDLSIEQVEALGEALLDFHGVDDFFRWNIPEVQ
jgi:Domain of unknown function (DUF4351)